MGAHIIYSVKQPLGDELRYSLRSVAAHMDVDYITFVGDVPDWVIDVEVIPGNKHGEAYSNSFGNALIAAKAYPETWYSFNDDFFVMQDVTEPIPHWWERSMVQQAARSPDPRSQRHRQLMLETNLYLSHQGVKIPKSYELHIPMRINGDELTKIASRHWSRFNTSYPPRWRSLYGNLNPHVYDVATQREDVKFHVLKHMPENPDFLSTDERTFKNFLPMLAKKFPKKSPWEK